MEGINFYAQDTWAVSSRVTLSLGLRYNNWTGGYPAQGNPGRQYGIVNFDPVVVEGGDVIEWNTIDPRLGATIQLDDAGKSVLRLGANRYHHSLILAFTLYGNPNSQAFAINIWSDFNQDLFAQPEELVFPFSQGGTLASVDPDLKQPYTDELFIGFERELFTDFSLKLNLSYRKDADLVETNNGAIDEDSFVPIQVPDPGADGEFGTSDDQMLTVYNQVDDFTAEWFITNPENADREYKGVELIATKRMSNNWQMLASFVWQDNPGTVGNQLFSTGSVIGSDGWGHFFGGFNHPNNQINIRGPLGLDRDISFKLSATYLLPLGFSVSGNYSYFSGFPLYRQYSVLGMNQGTLGAAVVASPRDSFERDTFSQLDLRAEKVFTFGSRPWEIGLIVDIFNVFNENNQTSQNSSSGSWDLATNSYVPPPVPFGAPFAIQAPQLLRIGARIAF
jgi:hypothetical protein